MKRINPRSTKIFASTAQKMGSTTPCRKEPTAFDLSCEQFPEEYLVIREVSSLSSVQCSVPVRKVPQVLKELTGISVTQSALTQDALRQAQGNIATQCQQLRASMATAPAVH